jgi:hypothetical protein
MVTGPDFEADVPPDPLDPLDPQAATSRAAVAAAIAPSKWPLTLMVLLTYLLGLWNSRFD